MRDNKQLSVFNFDKESVRVVKVDGDPWFVAKDVCTILGYKEPHKAVTRHCKGGMKRPVLTTKGYHDLWTIPEADLFRLAFRSEMEAAEQFVDWVAEEVLPSIRKTGSYQTAQFLPPQKPLSEWTPDELKSKCTAANSYGKFWGKGAGRWAMEQLGFPMPPAHLMSTEVQLSFWGRDFNA
ncbi:Bro-N domain-containing protein [Idiomarina abyssalis]|uniref:BRO-N domain-containing protein n=1 Tax=Idiomarina abyssalis TaxID=86102 RepID=UPI003A8F5184